MIDKGTGNKRILLLEDVDSKNASRIIRAIVEANIEDESIKSEMPNYQPEPVRIIINSYGGSLYDGLGIIGAIEGSTTPVYTVCYGSAMSMALFVLASGHYRYASKYATLMYHEISTEVGFDKVSGIEDNLAECKRLDEICTDILVKRSRMKKKELESLKKKSDWFFTPEIALTKGIIDEII